jgi:hypothetical protein
MEEDKPAAAAPARPWETQGIKDTSADIAKFMDVAKIMAAPPPPPPRPGPSSAAIQAFVCPITQEQMVDPVVALDGHSYSRAAIQDWFRAGRLSSPCTNERLASDQLVPNHSLRKAMEQRRDEQPMAIDPARLAVSEELLGEGSYGRVVAVEAIVQAMGRHCGSEGVQNAGCAALWDLGRSNSDMQQRINRDMQQRIKRAGAEEAVQRAMASPDATAKTKEHGQKLLSLLSNV